MSVPSWRWEYADYSFMFDSEKKWVIGSRNRLKIRRPSKFVGNKKSTVK